MPKTRKETSTATPKEEVVEFLRILDDGLSKLKRDYL